MFRLDNSFCQYYRYNMIKPINLSIQVFLRLIKTRALSSYQQHKRYSVCVVRILHLDYGFVYFFNFAATNVYL